MWVPVAHDDCTQSSEEECDAIEAIVDELLGRRVVDHTGVERPMTRDDILIVAPFNLQVRCLRERLPGIRIGSVDKFQGQEAPVVIVSLCASTLDEAPRGAVVPAQPQPAQRGGLAGAGAGDRGGVSGAAGRAVSIGARRWSW